MSTPTPTSDRPFVCDCEESMRTACAGEPFYGSHEGKQYCVLHFPGDKSTFWDALKKKLSSGDFNFRGVWFPACTPFEDVRFTRDADFESACFLGEVDFDRSTFEGNADFSQAMFRGGAYFSDVIFKSVNFSGATFFSERGSLRQRSRVLNSSIRGLVVRESLLEPFSRETWISLE